MTAHEARLVEPISLGLWLLSSVATEVKENVVLFRTRTENRKIHALT